MITTQVYPGISGIVLFGISVADPDGVQGVHPNLHLKLNCFIFNGKIVENVFKINKTNPTW